MLAPRKLLAGGLALLCLAPAAGAQAAPTRLQAELGRAMSAAGSFSGAYVVNAGEGEVVFRRRENSARVLASNTKLFTTSAALARFGTKGRLGTEVLGRGALDERGTWRGDLYLRGGGDPTFGSRSFVRRAYGGGAAVEDLAARIEEAGIERVQGRIVGDESRFDRLRGGPYSGFGVSIWVGPLSALIFNRGLGDERGRSFQRNPASFAAARLEAALERRGIPVREAARAGTAPARAEAIASVDSPPMERIVRLTNKPSDNFFAETLLKDLALSAGARGSTRAGARVASRFARELGASVRLADGSGLSHGNRASPRHVVRLLLAMRRRDEFRAFYGSLPLAGRDGTLRTRMRSGPARGRCHAKTGTVTGVSALSGYCSSRSGELYAFSFLMNGVNVFSARSVQDRMAQAIAGS
jgi:D-alanyl-D-alanine carboxypeptidase/D-alanyl-D-alanine-endopeptidase (penicillin-binding protein 4)